MESMPDRSGKDGRDNLGLSSEAIDDIQIKTAGVDASAPLAEGMVINIATPSGTNQVKGSVGAVYTAIAWNDNNTPGGTAVVFRAVSPISRSVVPSCGAERGSSAHSVTRAA